MTEHNKELIELYGKQYIDLSKDILDNCLYLASLSYSVMEDEYTINIIESMLPFVKAIKKAQKVVTEKISEIEKES